MPIPGHPSIWRQRQEDHAGNSCQCKDHAELESLSDFRNLDKEVRGFYFFGGGTPSHVVAEHMGKDGGGDVEGEAAEENGEKQGPFEIEEDCIEHGYSVMASGKTATALEEENLPFPKNPLRSTGRPSSSK